MVQPMRFVLQLTHIGLYAVFIGHMCTVLVTRQTLGVGQYVFAWFDWPFGWVVLIALSLGVIDAWLLPLMGQPLEVSRRMKRKGKQ